MLAERNSSIELLKIIAVFIIVVSHSLPRYGDGNIGYIDIGTASLSYYNILLQAEYYLGQIGNCIYMVCSSWFLVSDDKVKAKKIFGIWMDVIFFSIVWLSIMLLRDENLAVKQIIKSFLPIGYQTNWYVTCYILIYGIHSILNIAINSISREYLLFFTIILVTTYSIINTVFTGVYYYNELIGFIMIYTLVGYIKKYCSFDLMQRIFNAKCLIVASLLLAFVIIFSNIIGVHYYTLNHLPLHWCAFYNPLIIIIALSLFMIFYKRCFCSKIINQISALSLYIYIIHGNMLFTYFCIPKIWNMIFSFSLVSPAVWSIVIALCFFVISLVIGFLYRCTFNRLTLRIAFELERYTENKVMNKIKKISDKLEKNSESNSYIE